MSVGLCKSIEKFYQRNMKGHSEFLLDSKLSACVTSNNQSAPEQLLSHLNVKIDAIAVYHWTPQW